MLIPAPHSLARIVAAALILMLLAGDPLSAQPSPGKPALDGHNSHDARDGGFLLYRSALAAAEKALRLDETRDARYWLHQAPAPVRGWEWQYLEAQCDESIAAMDFEKDLTAIAVSPDGQLAAVAAINGGITLVDLNRFEIAGTVGDHADAVYSVMFSADSQRLVTVSRDVTSRVWDVATGKEIAQISLDNPGVAAATFSPDGKLAATCTWYMTGEGSTRTVRGVVWIWDAASGEVKTKHDTGIKPLDSIAWSADGSRLVAGSWDGLVHVFDASEAANGQLEEVRTIRLPQSEIYNAVISVAINADGTRVAAGSKDRTARIWDTGSGELLTTCEGHGGFVTEVHFADDQSLLTASVDGTVRLWSTGGESESRDIARTVKTLRGHSGSVTALAATPDGASWFSTGRDRTLRRWDPSAEYQAGMRMAAGGQGSYATVFSPDGSRLYVACHDGMVRVLDTRDGKVLDEWEAHPGSTCNTLALSGDGQLLVTCSWDKTARLWNPLQKELLNTLDAGAGVYDCAMALDGSRVALAVGERVQVWGTSDGGKLAEFQDGSGTVHEVALSPNGGQVACAGDFGTRVWQVDSKEKLFSPSDSPSTAITFSPDGDRLASAATGNVTVWRTNQWQEMQSTPIGDSSIYRLAFSPDGIRLAAASDAIVILDPEREGVLLQFQPNLDTIYYLSFSPDGTRLANCTSGDSIVISESQPLRVRLAEAGTNR